MFIEKNKCCGCGACVNTCPKKCISMQKDNEGFSYPSIDDSVCVKCGLCEKSCPVLNSSENEERIPDAYAVKIKDTNLRLVSSSGGMFSVLADYILGLGGVVCGAAMTSDCKAVEHIIIDKQEDLFKLRGSKYVQSNIGFVYKELLTILNAGKQVLFSGTPCQISGLRSFLKKEYNNLLCVEVICHGVPSPDLWKKYTEDQERKNGAKIVNVNFRNKKLGWKYYEIGMETSQQKLYLGNSRNNPYLLMFLRDYCLRPSCYNCHAKNFKPRADFTIADFWGIQNAMPGFYDDKGISLVLLHNNKAKNIFEAIKENIEFQVTDCMTALKSNMSMLKSVKRPSERDSFFSDMNNMDFSLLSKKYAYVPLKQRIRNYLELKGYLAFLGRLYKPFKNIFKTIRSNKQQ